MLLKIKQLGRQSLNSNPFRLAHGACHQPKWKELRRHIFSHNSNQWKSIFFFLFSDHVWWIKKNWIIIRGIDWFYPKIKIWICTKCSAKGVMLFFNRWSHWSSKVQNYSEAIGNIYIMRSVSNIQTLLPVYQYLFSII